MTLPVERVATLRSLRNDDRQSRPVMDDLVQALPYHVAVKRPYRSRRVFWLRQSYQ